MRKLSIIIMALGLLVSQAAMLSAATRSLTMTMTIPSASGVAVTAFSVNSAGQSSLLDSTSTLNFGSMTFDTTNNMWRPEISFAIWVSPTLGSQNLNTTVTYVDGNNPNGPSGKGLGWHAAAKFRVFAPRGGQGVEVDLPAHGPKKLLKDITGESFTSADLGVDGHLIIYMRIATGDLTDPLDAVPFTNSDAFGTYDGTLTITATVS